jgi:hypothetical protein
VRTRQYRQLLDAAAALCGLPLWTTPDRTYGAGCWLEGLVLGESAGNPKARRYERHQDRPGPGDADLPDQDDGLLEDDASYGLMQVMGYNIRQLVGVPPGTPMTFGFALLPITNISLGLRVLLGELAATDWTVARALARYNGGPTGDRIVNGTMRRQIYVDHIQRSTLSVWQDRKR